MNNEQIIAALEELKNNLPMSDLDRELSDLEEQAASLRAKLQNNDNYRDRIEMGLSFRQNYYNYNIADAQSNVDSLTDEINYITNKIEMVEQDINENANEFDNARLETLKQRLSEAQETLAPNQAKLDDFKKRLESFENRLATEPGINLNEKIADENRVERIEDKIDALATTSYNKTITSDNINAAIEEVKNGDMTNAITILTSVRDTLADTSMDSNREEELAKVEQQLNENAMELANIQTKLSDKLNYVLSGLETEFKIDTMNERKDALEDRIARLKASNGDQSKIDRYTNLLNKLREESSKIPTNEDINKIKDLRAKLAEAESKGEKAEAQIIFNDLAVMVGSLGINDSEYRLDQKKEADLLSAKAALEQQKNLLQISNVEKIENILSELKTRPEEKKEEKEENKEGVVIPMENQNIEELKVAYSSSNEGLRAKAKERLAGIKAKLASMKKDGKFAWTGYIKTALAAVGLASIVNMAIPDAAPEEPKVTIETITEDEAPVVEETLDNAVEDAIKETVETGVGIAQDAMDSLDKNNTNTTNATKSVKKPVTNVVPNATIPQGQGILHEGDKVVVQTPNGNVETQLGPGQWTKGKISSVEEKVSSNPQQQVISQSTTVTGGEQIGSKTEVVEDTVNVPNTNTTPVVEQPAPAPVQEQPAPAPSNAVEEVVVEDEVVLPDIPEGSVIVNPGETYEQSSLDQAVSENKTVAASNDSISMNFDQNNVSFENVGSEPEMLRSSLANVGTEEGVNQQLNDEFNALMDEFNQADQATQQETEGMSR